MRAHSVGMPSKTAANPLPIGEFARRAGLSASAVRFYVDAGLLDADVQASNGYRFFDVEQLARAELVRQLRALGMSLKEVASVLSSDNDAATTSLIDQHWASVQAAHEKAHTARAWLQAHLLKETNVSTSCTIESGDFRAAVEQVLPAAAEGIPEHPALSGIQFQLTADSLSMLTTDRFRLAVRDIVAQSVSGEPASIVLDAQAVRVLCEQVDGAPWGLLLDAAGATVRTSAGTTTVPAIAGDFPDCRALLRRIAAAGQRVSVPARALGEALRAVAHLPQVTLEIRGDRMTVTHEALEPCAISGVSSAEPFTVVVNPSFLLAALVGVVGPDVVLQLNGPLDPMVISSADDGTFTSAVMPIRPERT